MMTNPVVPPKPNWVYAHEIREKTLHDWCDCYKIPYVGILLSPPSAIEMIIIGDLLKGLGYKLTELGTNVVNAKLEPVYKTDVYSIGHGGSSGPMGEHPWLGDEPDEVVWVRCL